MESYSSRHPRTNSYLNSLRKDFLLKSQTPLKNPRSDLGGCFQQKIEKPRLAVLDQLRRQRRDAEAAGKPALAIENRCAERRKAHDEIIDGKLPPSLANLRSFARKQLDAG